MRRPPVGSRRDGDGAAARRRRRLVGADPLQRRRVGVQGGGGLCAGMPDAVDGLAGDGDDVAWPERPLDRPGEREALLGDLALEDGDRGGAVVVVVEAGVVTGHPADEVDLDVVVAVEELVGALVRVVADEGLPGVGLVGPGLQGLRAGALTPRPPGRRHPGVAEGAVGGAGLDELGEALAEGLLDGIVGSALSTGKSVPWTSWPMPTAVAMARDARGPYEEVS